MALDKVVDSAALDAGMASVADAIRAKAGITESLVWPDGFKAAVESITGGGNQVETGRFVVDSTKTITIPCAFEPDVIVITREEPLNTEGDVKGILEFRVIKNWFSGGRYVSADGGTTINDSLREWSPSGYGSFGLSYADGVISGELTMNGRTLRDGYTYIYIFGRCGL